MPKEKERLAVRRHSRRECDLAARLCIDDLHEAQVVFSNAVAEADGSLPLRIVDCSEGGLGLRSPVYVPRGAQVVVEVTLDGADKSVQHRIQLRVQRSVMVDREPAYYLGTSLVDQAAAAPAIGELLAAIGPDDQAAEGSGAAA